ncbi:UDP-glycosyltransferase 74E2-like [Salvia miltiorrhiza]|uniref:UDP-glycosyltransferase 74E2-like n=1 Tax=Salvia miltiorrhiza TaxID=226208 RepID=UPI0025AC20D8|nr:UDP-glycosyltransferase 74E2-like [Salvia miltiorrhiza]
MLSFSCNNQNPLYLYHTKKKKKKSNHKLKMATKTHILAIPFPLQGHINPMVQLCNRLASKGVGVTLVTTATFASRLERRAAAGDGMSKINSETVPDPTVGDLEALDVYDTFIRTFRTAITSSVPDIIDKHINTLSVVVYDSYAPWVLDIAHGKGLKGAVLFTQPCTVCTVFYHVHKGSFVIPPGDDDEEVSLPAMPAMRVRDLPSLVSSKNAYPSVLTLLVEQFSTFEKADWRLFNTFDKLEDEILKWMSKKYTIRTIGPTVPSMYTDKRLEGNYDYGLSLFKPKIESCKRWLDEKEDRSVVYVSFGSLADLSEKQMEEVAWGLIGSECDFLWVVREAEQGKLPRYFGSGPTGKYLIVDWCTQLEVLSHRAVGCFMTHCGWNSTLEALCLGVPMVAMPRWTDQTTTAKLIVDMWQIGVRVEAGEEDVVTRGEVAARVNEAMQRDRGRGEEMRGNALKWKDLAIEAVSEGGSSDQNITEIVREFLNNK